MLFSKTYKERACKECNKMFLPKCASQLYCCPKCGKTYTNRTAKIRNIKKAEKFKKERIEFLKNRKFYWSCPKCGNRIELNFEPIIDYKKLKEIVCKCGYKNNQK